MEFQLGSKLVNPELLNQQMEGFSTWGGFKESSGIYYAVVTDLSEQAGIQAVFDAHDGTQLTPEQADALARKAMYEEANTSRVSAPLVKTFNDLATASMVNQFMTGVTPETFDSDAFCAEVYAKWALVFESLDSNSKLRFMMYAAIHDPSLIQYPLPETPTLEFKARFNQMISGTLGYMTDLSQMV